MTHDKFQRYQRFILSSVYSEPDSPQFHSTLITQSLDAFLPAMALLPDDAILDVGSGQGAFLQQMRARGFRNLTGITLSPDDAAACAAQHFPVLQCDFSDLPLPDASARLVWCRHALEHSPFPLFSLLEFNRVLQPGGFLYVEVPAPNCPRNHEANPNHFSILGDKMWHSLFLKSGFKLAQYRQSSFEVNLANTTFKELFYCFLLTKEKPLPLNPIHLFRSKNTFPIDE